MAYGSLYVFYTVGRGTYVGPETVHDEEPRIKTRENPIIFHRKKDEFLHQFEPTSREIRPK